LHIAANHYFGQQDFLTKRNKMSIRLASAVVLGSHDSGSESDL
jgi:hypothetical protein